jgi:hypothetical protein
MTSLLCRSRLALAVSITVVGACAPEAVAPTPTRVDAFITGVTARGGQFTAVLSDYLPPPASAGPIAHVPAVEKVSHAHGSRVRISVSGASDFTRVYVWSPGASGSWDILLPNGVTMEDLDLTVNSGLRAGNLRVRYTLEGPTGIGGATEQLLQIGT